MVRPARSIYRYKECANAKFSSTENDHTHHFGKSWCDTHDIVYVLTHQVADCTIRFRPVFALSMVIVYACCCLIHVGPTLTAHT
jgi:hypothetical protein